MRALNSPPPPKIDESELRAFGFSDADIKKQTTAPAPQVCEVYEENWPATLWYLEVQDCYRFAENGVCLGLNFPQVESEKNLSERKVSAQDFAFLKQMGQENTQILNRELTQKVQRHQQKNPQFPAPPD